MLEELDYAWAAGFVDGEGSIMLSLSRRKSIKRRGHVESKAGQVYVHFRVGQTDQAPLDKLMLLFGGKVTVLNMDMPSRRKNVLQFYEWNSFGATAVAALRKIVPYLMVKKSQAELAIEYFEKCNGVVGIIDTRIEYWETMRGLQQKGKHLQKDKGRV